MRAKVLLSVLLLILAGILFLTGCGGQESRPPEDTNEAEWVTITDMAGRNIPIPTQVDKVYTSGQVSTIMLYMLAPDKLLGWNYALNDLEKAFVLEEYQELTAYGTGDAVNYEAIMAAAPQMIVIGGTINDAEIDNADALQQQLNIPVVLVSGELEDTAQAMRFFAEIIGEQERGEELASYAEDTFAWLEQAVASVPENEKVTVYYGNGQQSLNTAPAGSASSEVLDMAGAINVAKLEAGSGSRIDVSGEQILAWDPKVVILNGEPKQNLTANAAVENFLNDTDYTGVQAVREGRIYAAPKAPFSWIDRPPGPNRLIGLYWTFATLYPQYTDFDMEEKIQEFYQLFYHMELTEEQMQILLTT